MRPKLIIPAVLGLLSLLSACSEGTSTSSQPASGDTATSAESSTAAESSEAQAPAAGECPVGDWQVATITGKSGAQVNGVPVTAKSGGGFTLSLAADNKWTLAGNNATVTLQAAGLSVDATVDGTAEGDYAKVGDTYAFRQQRATGKVTLKKPVAGVSSWGMDEVGPALAPDGQATLTCGPGTLQVSSETVVLELKGAGGGTGGGAGGTPTSTGGSSGGGGSLSISESAQSRTIDCAGRTVLINGSGNRLTFTGSCAAVNVNGSRNELTIEDVAKIAVNGSFNKVTWSSGNPATSNTGQGNTISKG